MRTWLAALCLLSHVTLAGADSGLPINQIQFVGSHNSYKQPMSWMYHTIVSWVDPDAALSLDYSHPPLEQQLDLGLRKLELDVFYRPDSRDFAVGHVQMIDMNSHCATLTACLTQLRQWSERHPQHEPIWISFDAKDEPVSPLPDPVPFDGPAFDAMDQVLEAVLGSKLIRPRDVKVPGQPQPMWPLLDSARGKFLLILGDSGPKRDRYAANWRQRPMFVSVGPEHPAAAIMIVNDPVTDHERIRELLMAGFMVRTRADADTIEARANDTRRRDAAFASGAQAVSTDYYQPVNPFGNSYRVWLRQRIRCNPITAGEDCYQTLSAAEN